MINFMMIENGEQVMIIRDRIMKNGSNKGQGERTSKPRRTVKQRKPNKPAFSIESPEQFKRFILQEALKQNVKVVLDSDNKMTIQF